MTATAATRNAFTRIASGTAERPISARRQPRRPAMCPHSNATKASDSRYRMPLQASSTAIRCPATSRIFPSRSTLVPATRATTAASWLASNCSGSVTSL